MNAKYLLLILLFLQGLAFADYDGGDSSADHSDGGSNYSDDASPPDDNTTAPVEIKQIELYSPFLEAPLHLYLSSNVLLKFDKKDIKGESVTLINIKHKDRTEFSYSDIVTLAHEFCNEDEVGLSEHDSFKNTEAIKADFNSMLKHPDCMINTTELINQVLADNNDNIINESQITIPLSVDVQLSCITGGGCDVTNYLSKPGQYFRLAALDIDNFGINSNNIYLYAHKLALQTALAAKNEEGLKLAYAYEAYADHFLINSFSSSRIRIPREELLDRCPEDEDETDSASASILTNAMFNLDAEDGLYMTSYGGDTWLAYGGSHFFTSPNTTGRKKAAETLQQSVNQIYSVYKKKIIKVNSMLEIMRKKLPNIEKISLDHDNLAVGSKPLFKAVNKRMFELDGQKYRLLNCVNAKVRYQK